MHNITYRFGFKDVDALSPAEAGKVVPAKIKERAKSLCEDIRAAMSKSGMTVLMIAERSGQQSSALVKSLTDSFSMSVPRMNLLFDLLFPGRTLDEIIYGEKLPMPLPNIDRTYLELYSYLYFKGTQERERDEAYIQQLIASKTPENATPYSRYFGVREDRWTTDPILPEYRSLPAVTNLTSYSMWRADEANLHFQTLLKASCFCRLSLDFLCRNDYSVCELYTEDNGKRKMITNSERKLLSKFCMLSYADKTNVICELLKLIDFTRHSIKLDLIK